MAADPYATAKSEHADQLAAEVARVYVAAQLAMVSSEAPLQIPGWFLTRLRDVLFDGLVDAAEAIGTQAGRDFGLGDEFEFEVGERTANYIGVASGKQATASFEAIANELAVVSVGGDLKEIVADVVSASQKVAEADSRDQIENVTNAALEEAAGGAGMTSKTWHTGTNPRPSHLAQDGETVPLGQRFANGQRFPGSPAPPEERAGCNCWMTFDRGDA